MVLACLMLSGFSAIKEYEKVAEALFYMESLVVFWFTVEFIFRWVTVLELIWESNVRRLLALTVCWLYSVHAKQTLVLGMPLALPGRSRSAEVLAETFLYYR